MKGKDLEESCDSNWTLPEYKSGMSPLYQSISSAWFALDARHFTLNFLFHDGGCYGCV